MKSERKCAGGRIAETKVESRGGIDVGIVAGYIAAWGPDTGIGARYGIPDQFMPGAFLKSIEEHKQRDDRQVRLKDMHMDVIGGFPIHSVFEDATGLYGRGEINLNTRNGAEAYSLAQQGVLVDFSIGFTSRDDKVGSDVRQIFEAIINEASIVDEPMHRGAQFEVKSVLMFRDLPLAPASYTWDESKALERIGGMRFDDGDGNYAFLCEQKMLPFADLIEGKLMAVPGALESIVSEIKSSGEQTSDSLKQHIERYFAKMGKPAPFSESTFFSVDEVKSWDVRTLEQKLISTGAFSKGAAKLLCSQFEHKQAEIIEGAGEGLNDLLAGIQAISAGFKAA